MKKQFLIFFGPPGSGKGTQAEMTAKRLKLPAISTGDLLRLELKKKSALGRQAKKYMDKGGLVPDELVERMILGRLKKPDAAAGAIFDGYPRTKRQQEFLLGLLKGDNAVSGLTALRAERPLTSARRISLRAEMSHIYAILIDVSDKAVKQRLGGRRACSCGAIYNLKTKPPKRAGVCDRCGKKLFIRDDDKPRVISDRLKVYHKQSQPLLDYWRKEGKLIKVNGEQAIEKVWREMEGRMEGAKIL